MSLQSEVFNKMTVIQNGQLTVDVGNVPVAGEVRYICGDQAQPYVVIGTTANNILDYNALMLNGGIGANVIAIQKCMNGVGGVDHVRDRTFGLEHVKRDQVVGRVEISDAMVADILKMGDELNTVEEQMEMHPDKPQTSANITALYRADRRGTKPSNLSYSELESQYKTLWEKYHAAIDVVAQQAAKAISWKPADVSY